MDLQNLDFALTLNGNSVIISLSMRFFYNVVSLKYMASDWRPTQQLKVCMTREISSP